MDESRNTLPPSAFHLLAESVPQIAFTATPDGSIDYYNSRWTEYTGLTLEQTRGWGWTPILHPDDIAPVMEIFGNALKAQEPYQLECRLKRGRDGALRWHLVRGQPVRGPGGEVVRWFGTSTDIDDQKQVESVLRTERARLREMLSQAPVAIALTRGKEHRIELTNAAYRELTSRTPDGKTMHEAFPELVGTPAMAAIEAVYTTGEPFVAREYPVTLLRSGKLVEGFYDSIYQPLRDAAGEIEGCISIGYEVTAQVRARRRVELSAEIGRIVATAPSLQKMLQGCAEALQQRLGAAFARVWTLNEQTRTLELRASAGLYTHLDGPHGRVPVGKFKIGRIAASGEPHLSNDVQNDPHVGDHEWARKNGMVAFAGYPLRIEARVIGVVALFSREPLPETDFQAVAAIADVLASGVQRKVAEEAQQRLIAALEVTNSQLQRSNGELDQFAYVASHDLKAPLRGIANLSEWVEEDLGEVPQGVREKLRLMRGRVHRMEALIDGILDYSRAGRVRHKPERVEVQRLLGEVTELLAPRPGVKVEIAQNLPTLETERVPLQQVFMNLVGNAIKHARRDDAQVQVLAEDEARFYHFTVRDNGQGIAPEFHERIWGIFQTLESRDKVEGTGIGLSVVKKIVESRGGKAWVESAQGQGAAFHFTWPKRDEQEL